MCTTNVTVAKKLVFSVFGIVGVMSATKIYDRMSGISGCSIMEDTEWSSLTFDYKIEGLCHVFEVGVYTVLGLEHWIREYYNVAISGCTRIITEYSGHDAIGTMISALCVSMRDAKQQCGKRQPVHEWNDTYGDRQYALFCLFPEISAVGDSRLWVLPSNVPRPLTRFIYAPKGYEEDDSIITVVDYCGMSMYQLHILDI